MLLQETLEIKDGTLIGKIFFIVIFLFIAVFFYVKAKYNHKKIDKLKNASDKYKAIVKAQIYKEKELELNQNNKQKEIENKQENVQNKRKYEENEVKLVKREDDDIIAKIKF